VAFLEIKDLTMRFDGLLAVDKLSMEVQEGEIVGLIGPNGAGKTTIFNMISGVYKPTAGKIVFQGKDLTNLKPHQSTRSGIARTFQQTTLFDTLSVQENLSVGLYLDGRIGFFKSVLRTPSVRRKEAELQEKAYEILKFTGLDEYADKPASVLPHGKKRTLGVAIALASNPKLLLLDEPMTGMNLQETEDMMALVKRVRKERALTSVVVEHNMKAVMGLCDKLVVVNYGEKLAEGQPEEVSVNPDVIEAYLGGSENVV
jgi:branched-chain amino acid transport system ATP-binding protein